MFSRISSASIAAAFTTSALLVLMTSLIAGKITLTPGTDPFRFELGRVEIPPPKPETEEALPEPPPMPVDTPTGFRSVSVRPIERVSLPVGGPDVGFAFAESPVVIEPVDDGKGPLVNVMSVAPLYPQRMLTRGIEGHVDLRFDVDSLGAPVNIVVTRSSHAGFERSAIAALQRFRYRGGESVGTNIAARGLEKRFTFEIDAAK